MALEIEDELSLLKERGNHITKISFVGYSLGGIIARYCIGLFFARGLFDRLQPANFTAFASPFLGVCVPNRGYHSSMYNALASRMLSASGRQLFLVDRYRDSNQTLLEVMVDPNSIFITGLKRFKCRALYASIVNDFFAPWFTTSFSRTDPFVDLDKVHLNYMKGYDSVLLDPACPVQRKRLEEPGACGAIYNWIWSFANKLPYYGLLGITLPLAITALTINFGIQTVRSRQRVLLHKSHHTGSFKQYHISYSLDNALENIATVEPHAYLSESEASSVSAGFKNLKDDCSTSTDATSPFDSQEEEELGVNQAVTASQWPRLSLDPRQEHMIDALSTLDIHKHPVIFPRHTTRMPRSSCARGEKLCMKAMWCCNIGLIMSFTFDGIPGGQIISIKLENERKTGWRLYNPLVIKAAVKLEERNIQYSQGHTGGFATRHDPLSGLPLLKCE